MLHGTLQEYLGGKSQVLWVAVFLSSSLSVDLLIRQVSQVAKADPNFSLDGLIQQKSLLCHLWLFAEGVKPGPGPLLEWGGEKSPKIQTRALVRQPCTVVFPAQATPPQPTREELVKEIHSNPSDLVGRHTELETVAANNLWVTFFVPIAVHGPGGRLVSLAAQPRFQHRTATRKTLGERINDGTGHVGAAPGGIRVVPMTTRQASGEEQGVPLCATDICTEDMWGESSVDTSQTAKSATESNLGESVVHLYIMLFGQDPPQWFNVSDRARVLSLIGVVLKDGLSLFVGNGGGDDDKYVAAFQNLYLHLLKYLGCPLIDHCHPTRWPTLYMRLRILMQIAQEMLLVVVDGQKSLLKVVMSASATMFPSKNSTLAECLSRPRLQCTATGEWEGCDTVSGLDIILSRLSAKADLRMMSFKHIIPNFYSPIAAGGPSLAECFYRAVGISYQIASDSTDPLGMRDAAFLFFDMLAQKGESL
jgi:hypothetical protein